MRICFIDYFQEAFSFLQKINNFSGMGNPPCGKFHRIYENVKPLSLNNVMIVFG